MGLLDSREVNSEGHRVEHVRVDRIGAGSGSELWWVALEFEDGSTKPQGMYTSYEEAEALGEDLARKWGVTTRITKVV